MDLNGADVTIDYGMVKGKRITRRFSPQQLQCLAAVLPYPITPDLVREHTREWAESMSDKIPECAANRFGRAGRPKDLFLGSRGKRSRTECLGDDEE